MTKTLVRPARTVRTTSAPRVRRPSPDVLAVAALLVLFGILTALTWRKWGVPEIDAGAELTTADLVARGELPYDDVRYYYGPLGLYALAFAFKVFGASFTTAFAFGLLQAAAILGVFYALARQWLRPLPAALTTAVLLAIGFSGTAFNFVLPHTNSATFGILFLLVMLLALARKNPLGAGIAVGLVGLTRPEFAAVAAAAALAYLLGTWRERGRAGALHAAWRLALPGIAVPVAVLGAFAAQVGASRLITENLWPLDFIRIAGFRTQEHWMPFTPSSFAALGLRALVYGGLLAALAATARRWSRGDGGRAAALWPIPAALLAIALFDGLLRATGLLAGQRSAIEDEITHLMLGMTWLPALAFAAAAWCTVRFLRHGNSPLGGSWAVDLALVTAAAALGLRAYNAFATEGSYAPYYAAPLVLLLGILHARIGDRVPAARVAVLAVLGLVAAGLAGYALRGLYADYTTTVQTPRGSFVTSAPSAAALQGAVDRVVRDTEPGEPILAAPADGGLYFMTGRDPALYEVMLLPGLLDSPADELGAIADLRRARVRTAAIAARDFSKWGSGARFGVDYNRVLGGWLEAQTTARVAFGTMDDPQAGTNPSLGVEVLTLGATSSRPAVYVGRRGCDDRRELAAVSRSRPLCDIARAIEMAPPGWRVLLAPGSYPALTVDARARRHYDVVVEGDGVVRIPRVEIAGGASGLRFERLRLTGAPEGPTFAVTEDSGAIGLARSRVRGEGQHAIELRSGTRDVVIEHNRIHTERMGSGIVMVSQAPVPGAPEEVEAQPPIRDVVVRGNHFDGIALDGIRPANFRRLTVVRNEFEGINATDEHNDVLQVVWGGRGLVFRDNVVHHNTGQGLFIKDGRVHDVTIEGNAFVQNRRRTASEAYAGSPIQLYDTVGVRIIGNTVWDNDNAVLLRTGVRDATIRDNILEGLVAETQSVPELQAAVDQDHNLVASGWNWGEDGVVGPNDIAGEPQFADPAALDYRLRPGSPGLGLGAGAAAEGPP